MKPLAIKMTSGAATHVRVDMTDIARVSWNCKSTENFL